MSEKINENPLILEPINVDLNKLFSLSYTFENLKSFMSSLSKNQSLMSDKINELETKLVAQKEINNNYQKSFNNLNKKLQTLEANLMKINIQKEKFELSKKRREKQIKKENINNSPNKIGENLVIKNEKEKMKEIKEEKKEEIKNEKIINEKEKSEQEKNEVINENFQEKEEKSQKLENNNENIVKEEKKLNNLINIEDKKNEIDKVENEIKINENIEEKEKNFRKESSFSNEIKSEFNNENFNDFFSSDNNELMEIKNKIENLESKLKAFYQPKIQLTEVNTGKEEIEIIKNQIKNISQKIEENWIQREKLQKKVEEISIKVLDFNIIDILKHPLDNGVSQDSDKLVILNLEQKFQKKTSILDEKIKKNEEEINKIKNNFDNIKINFDIVEQNINLFKNNMKDLKEEIIKSNVYYRNIITETSDNLNQKIDAQKKSLHKNLDSIKQQIKNINDKKININEDVNKVGPSLSDDDLKYISDLSKKVSDSEKQISLIFRNIESIRNKDNIELTKIENELIQKINQKEFFELNDKVNLQSTMSNNIREMVERVQELTNKNMKDLNFFLRKIESLSGSVVSIQNFLEAISGTKEDNSINVINYLEQESFNEFVKLYNKDKKIFERNLEEFRRIITDTSEIIKSKSSENDLKNFEAIINNKIEELKINCGKKFADKIEMAKNLKYLDAQIRYINELSLKREKNDNWLIAKKPVGGFSCASCESYIGDLKERGDYIAWSKYPQREKNIEKNYRVGNGFSRMLNMLNIDVKNSFDNFNLNNYESDDENINQNQHIHQTNNTINFNISQAMKTSSNKKRNSFKKSFNQIFSKQILPKINSLDNILNNENSLENFKVNKTIETTGSPNHINEDNKKNVNKDKSPHIVKVFKKKF